MNKLADKWLSKELYEVCPICDAVGRIEPTKFRGLSRTPDDDGLVTCPGCDGQKLIATGLTARQVEQLHARLEHAQAELQRAQAELVRLRSLPEIRHLITGEDPTP
jgi:hypothetical protein